ncbi:MAG: hypothetical protein U0835_00255 [Isosphaeraceae bacterium]
MPRVATLLAVCLLAGCNSVQLQFTTLRQSQTIPDLQQKQVLDNFARLSADAGLLPYFDLVSVGTSAVTDRGSASFDLKSVVREFTEGKYGAEAEREISGNWTISPTNDPNRLAAMRAAYMIALGRDAEIAPIDLERLDDFLVLNYDVYKVTRDPHTVIPSGWLCIGDKGSRPKHGHYVAHKDGVYVWVQEGRLRDLANFSLIILDIATLHPDLPVREPVHGEGGEAMAMMLASTESTQKTVDGFDSQIKLREKQIAAVQEKKERAVGKAADDLQAEVTTLEADKAQLVKDRGELLRKKAQADMSALDLQWRQNISSGAASRIPNRLNGPAFNQGLFLIPR